MSATLQIDNNTIVSLRYIMKNGSGEVLENNMDAAPVQYLHGCNAILPSLENALAGLSPGDKKSITFSDEQINETLYFDVIIDEVRVATTSEMANRTPAVKPSDKSSGPGCCC